MVSTPSVKFSPKRLRGWFERRGIAVGSEDVFRSRASFRIQMRNQGITENAQASNESCGAGAESRYRRQPLRFWNLMFNMAAQSKAWCAHASCTKKEDEDRQAASEKEITGRQ